MNFFKCLWQYFVGTPKKLNSLNSISDPIKLNSLSEQEKVKSITKLVHIRLKKEQSVRTPIKSENRNMNRHRNHIASNSVN